MCIWASIFIDTSTMEDDNR